MESLIERIAAVPGSSIRLDIDEQSQIGAARRSAESLGHAHALGSDAIGRLAIVVTEAATNIVRHAGRGIIVLRGLVAGKTPAVEVLALDKGPGIPDVERAMRDGYSTSGTAGQGLGGMQRLANTFEMHSQRGIGTALLARIGERPRPAIGVRPVASLDDRVGAVCVPLRGETACGDGWRIVAGYKGTSILLVDGLGHGPEAAAVAAIATAAFSRLASGAPEIALAAFDKAMRGTRGAALSVAVIDDASRTTRFSGVGNVDSRVLSGAQTEHLIPQAGIVGHTMPALRPVTAAWPVSARLVMYSDGISARWRADTYPGLLTAHPALLAGVIYRDFGRERDDVTVIVLSDAASHANT